MIRLPLLCCLPVAVLAVAVATIMKGAAGMSGALTGAVVVIAFFASTPLLLGPLVSANTVLSPVAALGFFTIKAFAVLVLMSVLFDVAGVASYIDRGALGLTAMVLAFVWTAAMVVAFKKDRTPIYNLDDESQ